MRLPFLLVLSKCRYSDLQVQLHKLHTVLLLFVLLFHSRLKAQKFDDYHIAGGLQKRYVALDLADRLLTSDIDSIGLLAKLTLLDFTPTDRFDRTVTGVIASSYFIRSGKPEKAIQPLKLAISYFEEVGDYQRASQNAVELGNALLLLGEYDESKYYYRDALELGKYSNDKTDSYNAKYGLGRLYLSTGDTSIALHLLREYRDLALNDKKYGAAADVSAVLFNVFDARKNVNLANEYLDSSVVYAQRSGSPIHLSNAYTNQGIRFFDLGVTDSAIYYFKSALKIREEMNNLKLVIESYYNLGSLYAYVDNKEKAKVNFTYSYELAVDAQLTSDAIDALDRIIMLSSHSKELINVKDSLNADLERKNGMDKALILKEPVRVNNACYDPKLNNRLIWIIMIILIVAGIVLNRKAINSFFRGTQD